MRTVCCFLLFSLIPAIHVGAEGIQPSLGVIIIGATAAPPGAIDDRLGTSVGLAFPGDELTLSLTLSTLDDDRVTAQKTDTVPLGTHLWRGLCVRFEPIENATFPAARTVEIADPEEIKIIASGFGGPTIKEREILALRKNERAWAKVLVPVPPPGDYRLRVTLPLPTVPDGVFSTAGVIAVRDGYENEAVRRAWLRSKARKTESFSEYKALQMELTALEPDNWIPWEELANRSLDVASADETASYYDRAYELFNRALASGAVPLSSEKARAQQAFLKLFKEIQPSYAAQRDRFVLEPIWDKDVKTFKVVDRKTGRTVATLDPMRPSIPKDRL